ncbi:hypothetical protein Anas_13024 [Armadillidium nasatum]|uniref:Transcription factor CBF/NF-Y/archaeal histone domain-containing protein n=1 Tax=Armadillidium nasatum TaxID=96803 RepID=A0A5N5T980_9CRUS|nr:hypothetical protein Anas_13024 [Armadillidium nasatum]
MASKRDLSNNLRPSSLWNDLNFLSILNSSSNKEENPDKDKSKVNDPSTDGQIKIVRNKHKPRISLARIRKMIKESSLNDEPSDEALFVIDKAVEIFIESLVSESYENVKLNNKRILTRRDVDVTIENIDSLGFLIGVLD